MVGNVGGSGRFAYSVIGDCPNTAARLESLNKQLGTRIIAAQAVVEGLDEIVSRPLGRFQLVGKGGALPVVEVVGLAADARPAESAPDFGAALEEFEQGRWADAAAAFRHHPRGATFGRTGLLLPPVLRAIPERHRRADGARRDPAEEQVDEGGIAATSIIAALQL